MQIKKYTVAGHTFSLEMENNSPLWESLAAYTAFETTDEDDTALDETDTDDAADIIFALRVTTEEEAKQAEAAAESPEEELTLIGNFDSEATRLTLFATSEGGREFAIAHRWLCPHTSCRLRISPDYRTATLTSPEGNAAETDPAAANPAAMDQLRSFGLANALMLLYAFTTSTRHTVLAHASVVMNHGTAYAFLGRSGTGKSTHTGLWLKHVPGSELLNDDNPVIRIEHGIARIYGSPWSGKTPCYRNLGAPLGGIVRLTQAPHNHIARLQNAAAYATIIPSFSTMKWERHMADGIHNTVSQLITATPIYQLQCLPDAAAAQLSAQTLQGGSPCEQ